MIKQCVFTPAKNRYHLGDLINISQQCFRMGDCVLCGTQFCDCCGNSVENTLLQILQLVDSNVRYVKHSNSAKELLPTWSTSLYPNHDRFQYLKSNLCSKKDTYVSYQFDARSTPRNRRKTIENSEKIVLVSSGLNLIDIGENSNLSIREKFDIVNKSVAYVGIDSGVSHLALMTNVPIYIVHPKGEINNPYLFYPETEQIKFFDNMMKVVQCLQT